MPIFSRLNFNSNLRPIMPSDPTGLTVIEFEPMPLSLVEDKDVYGLRFELSNAWQDTVSDFDQGEL